LVDHRKFSVIYLTTPPCWNQHRFHFLIGGQRSAPGPADRNQSQSEIASFSQNLDANFIEHSNKTADAIESAIAER
jgi:hypothetical protein